MSESWQTILENILESWQNRLKITSKDLNLQAQKFITEEIVKYQPNLAEKYLSKYVTYSAEDDVDSCFELNIVGGGG